VGKTLRNNQETNEMNDVLEELHRALDAEFRLSTSSANLNSLAAADRVKATNEFGMHAAGHLAPQGSSSIVSSDTVEVIEGLEAVISELVLDNDRLAAFEAASNQPKAMHDAMVANDLINYEVFQRNKGWVILNDFLKAALLWRNSVLFIPFEKKMDKTYDRWATISQTKLDFELGEEGSELISYSDAETVLIEETQAMEMVYRDAVIAKVHDNSRIGLVPIPPENFVKSNDSDDLDHCRLTGFVQAMSRSEIRKRWGEAVPELMDPDGFTGSDWSMSDNFEEQTRRDLTEGLSTDMDVDPEHEPSLEEEVLFAWFMYDIDGDGINELLEIESLANRVLSYRVVEFRPLADLGVFKIPHEWASLSAADMVRPTMLASTAIMRGFIENVYLTNHSPKLADPNAVDFGLLQNIRPKQVIPTNGNPNNAVASLAPDTISPGTVPILEALQLHKEQATGLSKASQGLNDTLYVSGNSESKLARVQSAAQVRLQHLARRMIETGFRKVAEIVYRQLREHFSEKPFRYVDRRSNEQIIEPGDWPDIRFFRVKAGVGENSNANLLQKYSAVGQQVLPGLREAGAAGLIKPTAVAMLAFKTLEAMNLDPLMFLEDPNSPDFEKRAEEDRVKQQEAENKAAQIKEQLEQLDIEQRKATIALTNVQARNALQDNTRQLMIAMDTSMQKWAEIRLKYTEKALDLDTLVKRPTPDQLFKIAMAAVSTSYQTESAAPIPGGPDGTVQGTPAESSLLGGET
jgi:hypothetical protein